MKPCKSCNKMIAKSAKACPFCGGYVHHNVAFVLKIFALIGAFNVFVMVYVRLFRL